MLETKPWELLNKDKERCHSVIGVILNLIKLLGIIFEPYMPALSAKIATQLNYSQNKLPEKFELDLPTGGNFLF
jgi:methionyl-tRNA synthetase